MDHVAHLSSFLRAEQYKSPYTLRNHDAALNRFGAWLADRGLTSLTCSPLDLQDYYCELMAAYVPDSANNHIGAIRVYFRWLCDVGLRADNPADFLKLAPQELRPVESLNVEQMQLLLRHANKVTGARFGVYRAAVAVVTLLDTGIRIGELLRLRTADVDMQRDILHVTATKTRSFRIAPFSEHVHRQMAAYLRRRKAHLDQRDLPDGGYLWIAEHGGEWTESAAGQALRNAGRMAGLRRRFYAHLCRHTFATQSLINDAPLPGVMRLMGHKRLSTTQRYTWMTDQQLREIHAASSPVMAAKRVRFIIPEDEAERSRDARPRVIGRGDSQPEFTHRSQQPNQQPTIGTDAPAATH